AILAEGLRRLRYEVGPEPSFDTLRVQLGSQQSRELMRVAEAHRVNLRALDAHAVGVSLDGATSAEDMGNPFSIWQGGRYIDFTVDELAAQVSVKIEAPLARKSAFLTHPVFNCYHSETEMLRYIRRLESRDLSLTPSMIPLGSCTMKLNA